MSPGSSIEVIANDGANPPMINAGVHVMKLHLNGIHVTAHSFAPPSDMQLFRRTDVGKAVQPVEHIAPGA